MLILKEDSNDFAWSCTYPITKTAEAAQVKAEMISELCCTNCIVTIQRSHFKASFIDRPEEEIRKQH